MRGLLWMLTLLCASVVSAAPYVAANRPAATAPGMLRVADRQISVNEAARIAQRAVGGRVLSAESANHGGRPVVRVKLLTREGVVRVVVVDATTGKVD